MKPDEAAAALASDQHGVITAVQALSLGLSVDAIRHRVRAGRWQRVHRGVFAIGGSPRTWEQQATADVMSFGSRAVASHLTAGALLGLLDRRPTATHVTMPTGQHRKDRGRIVVHEASLGRRDVLKVSNIPSTCANRTVVDLAGTLRVDRLAAALDSAIVARLTSVEAIARYIRERNLGTNLGAGKLRRLLEDRTRGVPESELERLFLRKLRRSGLPGPVPQFRLGRRRIDLAYPKARVAIELDGLAAHFAASAFEADRRRQNELVLLGWVPLRFTWTDVTKGWVTVEKTLRRALAVNASVDTRASTP